MEVARASLNLSVQITKRAIHLQKIYIVNQFGKVPIQGGT